MRNRFKLSIVVAIVLIVTLACGTTTSETLNQAAQTSTAVNNSQNANNPTSDNPQATNPPADRPTNNPPAATKTPKPQAQDLKATGDQAFVQKDSQLAVVFSVENPNTDSAITDSEYQVIVYDASGTVLKSENGYIEVVLPGEKLYLDDDIYLNEGQKASTIEVQVNSGDAQGIDITPPLFTTDQVNYVPDEYLPRITGIVVNTMSRSFNDLEVTAVAYDASGAIIGGGYSYLDFLPGNGKSAIDVSVLVEGIPAKVELYPMITGLSMLTEDNSQNQTIELVDYGFTQTEYSAIAAFIVQTIDDTAVIDDSEYQIAAYDAQGVVVDTESGYIDRVFPGEQTGFAVSLYPSTDVQIASIEVQLNSGGPTTSDYTSNPFTVDSVTYVADEYYPTITGLVLNSFTEDASDVVLYAIGFDKDGNIIGGGNTYVDFVPGNNGKAAFEIGYTGAGKPVTVTVYPILSSFTDFGE